MSSRLSDPTHGRIVVMGVAGCGKSTVAAALADRIGGVYVDGDTLHPEANIAKMAAGQPLDDDDRRPWLEKVGEALHAPGTVMACSSLKRAYRDVIRGRAGGGDDLVFLYLKGSRALLTERMAARRRHFMPLSLLDSQLATLEEPGADENAIAVDIDRTVPEIVDAFLERLAEREASQSGSSSTGIA